MAEKPSREVVEEAVETAEALAASAENAAVGATDNAEVAHAAAEQARFISDGLVGYLDALNITF